MPYYVVVEPLSRRIYESWEECKLAIDGVKGAKYQKVQDLDQATAMLEGGGVVLSPGLHVFTDGNHEGGVGVVIAWMSNDPSNEPAVVTEIATSVEKVFYRGVIPGLQDGQSVDAALKQSRNILSELAGLYLALSQAPKNSTLSIVHDYKGVAEWMEDRWEASDPVLKAVIAACKGLEEDKHLVLEFVWQKGHTSSRTARHDLAKLNTRADELATMGISSS